MADTYKVTAAAVVVPVGATEVYLYKGAILPDEVKAADRNRLVGIGLVAKVTADEPDTSSGGSELYDPGAHTADEVVAHVKTVDDAERDRIITAERAGKGRSTLLADLEKLAK